MPPKCPTTAENCRYMGCTKRYCRLEAAKPDDQQGKRAEAELKRYQSEALTQSRKP